MKSVAKGLLYTILTSIAILLIMNMIYFFPWYMTVVTETFNLTQIVSTDNYLKDSYYIDSLDRIRDKPIFRENRSAVTIVVTNDDGYSGIGNDDADYYYDDPESLKPYRQRGEPITVTLSADYVLSVTLWSNEFSRNIPVTFTLTTSGLTHYKDLP